MTKLEHKSALPESSVANIQIILNFKILMNKKYQSFQKRWLAYMLATILQIKCDERQKSGYNRGHHTDNGEPMISHLTSVLAEKSSFLHHCSSFVSYLIAIGILLKKAFTHKTGQSLIIMGGSSPLPKRMLRLIPTPAADTIQGCIAHELGHHMQWTMMPANLFNSLREGMAVTAQGLSGYAGTSGTEYVAESFVSWLKGELRIDYRLQEFFDSKCQIRPVDGGTWKDVETSSGSVRISSLHGINETSENLKIAKYLAEKHGRELDLIPRRKNVKTPDSFDKGDGRFVEFKTNSSATANSIDRALRDASHQADNIVISLERGLPLGTLASVIHDRTQREQHQDRLRHQGRERCPAEEGRDPEGRL